MSLGYNNVYANIGLALFNSLPPVNNRNDESTTCVQLSHILPAYKNCDCPAISTFHNRSDAQGAPNWLNQVKVYHFQPIEKIACGMLQ